MTQQRWMVVKVTPPTMLLMSNDGEFRRVPALAAARPGVIMERLPAVPVEPRAAVVTGLKRAVTKARAAVSGWRVWAAAAAVILMLVPGYFWVNRPAALIAMDINPSLELYVGAEGRVRKVEALNPEARDLIRGAGLRGEPWQKAIEEVIDRSREAGFLQDSKENAIALTVVPLRTDRQPVDVKMAAAEIGQVAKDRGLKVIFTAGEAPRKQLSSARKEGLSLNRFLLMEAASRAGLALKPEYVEEMPLVELIEEAGVPVEGVEPAAPVGPVPGQEGVSPEAKSGTNGAGDATRMGAPREPGPGTGILVPGVGEAGSGRKSGDGKAGIAEPGDSGTSPVTTRRGEPSGDLGGAISNPGEAPGAVEGDPAVPGPEETDSAGADPMDIDPMDTDPTDTDSTDIDSTAETGASRVEGGRLTDGEDSDLEPSRPDNDSDGNESGVDEPEAGSSEEESSTGALEDPAGQSDPSDEGEAESDEDGSNEAGDSGDGESGGGQDSGDDENTESGLEPSEAQQDTSGDGEEAGDASTGEAIPAHDDDE